jgi:hypothetical protein
MLEVAEPVEKTMLGNVICEETAADDADPELDTATGMDADALGDELSTELLEALNEDMEEGSEAVEVALVI